MDALFQQVQEAGWEILFICIRILIILLLAWFAMVILKKMLRRLEFRLLRQSKISGEPPSEAEKRLETITRLVKQAALIVLWVVIILTLLREIGVNIGPILASAGIVGLAVGFGAQNLVRDFIAGFFFILENQVRVGDVVIVNGTGGLVEKLNFRTIVLRDLGGSVHVFPNGAVNTLSNLTNDWSAYVFDIGVAYKENTDRVIEVMTRVGSDMKEDALLGPYMLAEPEIFGVDKFDTSAVIIKGRIKTKPIRQWLVGREYLRRIKLAFDDAGI
ncbi:MAG TPA: mechanosensitive ion channel family protein, partial [Desulfotignum sp.]|nr:mechanosensitive ion channel family protein [Desulfotignum sp.]